MVGRRKVSDYQRLLYSYLVFASPFSPSLARFLERMTSTDRLATPRHSFLRIRALRGSRARVLLTCLHVHLSRGKHSANYGSRSHWLRSWSSGNAPDCFYSHPGSNSTRSQMSFFYLFSLYTSGYLGTIRVYADSKDYASFPRFMRYLRTSPA